MADAVLAGGGELVELGNAEALIWLDSAGAAPLERALSCAPAVRWVQLPVSGIEAFLEALRPDLLWTSARDVWAEPVAEHALALVLAGLRQLNERLRADSWGQPGGRTLFDAKVTIVGGGCVSRALLKLLTPFRVETTVIRRRPEPVPHAGRVLGPERLRDALGAADVTILALALTPATRGMIGASELEAMHGHAWLVNVARGAHVVTEDLVRALAGAWIGGAALDVTDPEPLPPDHPLWRLSNCIVTPHTAGTSHMLQHRLAGLIRENVRLYSAGETLRGRVDATRGY